MSQEERDRQTLQGYTIRFHKNYQDIKSAVRCYLTEEEEKYQHDIYEKGLRGKPADPEFMRRDLFEKIRKDDQESRNNISLSGGYGGSSDIPASRWEEQQKRYEEEQKRAEKLCKVYKEELYPKELQDYEYALYAVGGNRNAETHEKEKWRKMVMMNRPSIDEIYTKVFGKQPRGE